MKENYTSEEIAQLSPQERIAGYLYWEAKLTFLGAMLRVKYKDVATDYSEGWSPEEDQEWDEICEQHEIWWYAVPLTERGGIVHKMVSLTFNQLTCGRLPITDKEKVIAIINKE